MPRRVHHLATGLFLFMVCLYAAARTFQHLHPAIPYFRAFAEAGMVGALADWFAVVALFRHPLGQKWIPHTAIIANRKDQIADSLAHFVEQHFLNPDQITARIDKIAIADRAAQWLQEPNNAEKITSRVAANLPAVLNALDDSDMRRFLHENLIALINRTSPATITSRVLTMLVEKDRHQEIFQQGLELAKILLDDNTPLIEDRIAKELSKVPSFLGLRNLVVKNIAQKIVSNIHTSLDDVVSHEQHPTRDKFHQRTLEFIEKLETSPEWQARLEEIKQEFLDNPTLAHTIETLWTGIKNSVIDDLEKDQPRTTHLLATTLRDIGRRLQNDQAFRSKLNGWVLDITHHFTTHHSDEIGNLIRDTVAQWNGAELAAKLEAQVGSDLQYIRINGTLVGGLVGLLLHILSHFIWK